MKKIFTIVLSLSVYIASAQWTNTNNTFTDSLHMPVAIAASSQRNAIVINSYPDGGYFVIWEDDRNTATTQTDIYAQKFDAAGERLWALNGVPVANGTEREHFTFSSNEDYRNRTYAATDSAGGFYLAYASDSISSYVFERVVVQHVRSTGTNVFPGGYILARSAAANLNTSPLLLADGNKGFFVAYKTQSGNDYINVYCYNDEGGNLKYYGGGRVNENALQVSSVAPCGIKTDVIYPGTTVSDFNIWSDGYGGCNVVMAMNGNNGQQGNFLAYNRLFRVKKDCSVKTYYRNTVGMACPFTKQYQKDDVSMLYYITKDYQSVFCTSADGTQAYGYTNYRLLSNGYQVLDNDGYDYNYPKGVVVNTSGNIMINMIAVTKRTLINNNTVTPFMVQGIALKAEKYDSIPYQRASYANPEIGFNPVEPFGIDKVNNFRDTILGTAAYYVDFTLAGGGSHVYASALMGNSGVRLVRLQNLEISKKVSDSFAIEYKTNILSVPEKNGVAIGGEVSTGFSGNNISYDQPLITITNSGQALFYIREYYRSARVSPIGSGAELNWGAMGRPISAGVYNNSYYNLEQPVAVQDTAGTAAIIAWRDDKYLNDNSGDNIFMRHLDKLDVNNYTPPINPVAALYNQSGTYPSNPVVLLGSSKVYSNIDVYNAVTRVTTTVADIKDDNYLGSVITNVYQQLGAARTYNNQPYLGRNYTFKPDSLPPNASFDVLLYFTTAEFAALKAADVTITDPGLLTVVRQPNATATAPAAYVPVTGEEILSPITWDSTPGGFYLRVTCKGLGNFFIRKIQSAALCPGGNTTFSSNVTGSSYQWQVSSGPNFINVANGGNYSGATTATLQVSNVPASFNANRYRCVVDNINVSNTYFLQVGNVWTGAVDNKWETPGNWSCGTVPDANANVIINSGTVTVSSNATCRSLTLNAGANVTVQTGFSLDVMH